MEVFFLYSNNIFSLILMRKYLFIINIFSCWCTLFRRCCGPRELKPRTIMLGKPTPGQFPANAIRNQKYNIVTFLPLVLYQQFKFFLNLYFLIMATSQFVPDIRISYLYTYWIPLVSFFLRLCVSFCHQYTVR